MPNEQKKNLVLRTRKKREVYHDKRPKNEKEKKHNHKRKDIFRGEASVTRYRTPHRPLQIVNGGHNNTLAKELCIKIEEKQKKPDNSTETNVQSARINDINKLK